MSWMNVDQMVGRDAGYVCGRAPWQPNQRIALEADWLRDDFVESDEEPEWDDDAPRT